MSNDLSGLPGICTAVRHLVCVVVGAPGPVQAASADPTPSSSTGMMTIKNSESASESFRSMACLRFEDRCCEATLPVRSSLPAPCRREFRTDFGDASSLLLPRRALAERRSVSGPNLARTLSRAGKYERRGPWPRARGRRYEGCCGGAGAESDSRGTGGG